MRPDDYRAAERVAVDLIGGQCLYSGRVFKPGSVRLERLPIVKINRTFCLRGVINEQNGTLEIL